MISRILQACEASEGSVTTKTTFNHWLLLFLVSFVMAGLWSPYQAHAARGDWDHAANIKDAASRLAVLHKREGSQGVLKFLDACYRTHLLASDYTKGLEACMAQDYMHTQVLAIIYAKLPEDERKKVGAPSPEAMANGMNQRFVTSFMQYKVTVADGEDFKKLVDKHGFPVFVKAIFPKDKAAGPGSDNPSRDNPSDAKPAGDSPAGEK
jgi:hypothetical protein